MPHDRRNFLRIFRRHTVGLRGNGAVWRIELTSDQGVQRVAEIRPKCRYSGRPTASFVCVFFLSLVCGVPAFAQQSGPGASRPAFVLDEDSESQQVRQKLESLRDSYWLRLQELDDQMKRLKFQSEAPQSVYQELSHTSEVCPTRSDDAHAEKYSPDGLFGDRIQVTLGGGGILKLYGYARRLDLRR